MKGIEIITCDICEVPLKSKTILPIHDPEQDYYCSIDCYLDFQRRLYQSSADKIWQESMQELGYFYD